VTRSQRTLTIASAGTLTTLVAFTAPLATVNATVAGLGAGVAGHSWILSSMSIGLGGFLLTAGRVADDLGRRRTFAAGALLLALGSLAAAVVTDVPAFVAARIVQGVGGAAIVAASLGMVAATFTEPRERAHATGVWGASVGAGIAVGPLLSAGLWRVHSWRDVYVVIAIAGVALAVSARGCPESRAADRARLDLPGVLLLALGVSAVLAGLTEGRLGWTRPLVVVLLAGGVVLLASFVVVEWRSDHAMLDLRLFARPAFLAVTLAGVATGGGVIALMSYVSGFVGLALGLSSWSASWLLLVWSGPSIVAALAARRQPAGWSGRSRLVVSLVGVGVGQLLMWHLSPTSGWARLLPGLLVAGVASGLLNAALGRESVASVPAGQGGLGSGANNTARYLGSAVGITVISIVAAPSGVATTASLVTGWNRAVLVTAAVSLVGAALVAWVGERPEQDAADLEALEALEAPPAADQAQAVTALRP
jgi:MFS family permease